MSEDMLEKIKELSKNATEENKKEIFEEMTDVLTESLAQEFGVEQGEVGIIILTSNQKFLRFIAPKTLYKGGATFPMSKRESVATKVLTTKKGDIKNDLHKIKHLSIYEHVKTSEDKPKPIQKMMTVPLILNDKAVGVIQISRKGNSEEEAGPDFTQEDIEKLMGLAQSFLPPLFESKPAYI